MKKILTIGKHKLISTFVACIFLFVHAAPAQETSRVKDCLQYFPKGTYLIINFTDGEAMSKAAVYPLYRQYAEKTRKQSNNTFPSVPLLGVFKNNDSLRAGGKLFKITTTKKTFPKQDPSKLGEKLKEEHPNMTGSMVLPSKDQDDAITALIDVEDGDSIWVLWYDDLDTLMKKAMENGEIQATGESISGKPVYTIDGLDLNGGKKKYFAAVAMTGELLLAGKLENLKRMISAGAGQSPNILEDDEYIDLIEILPDLGQSWIARYSRSNLEKLLKRFERLDGPTKELEKAKGYARKFPYLSISSTTLDAEVIVRYISVFMDEESAQAFLERGYGFARSSEVNPEEFKKARESMDRQREKKSTIKREGNVVVRTTVMDEEFYKAVIALTKAFREWQEEEEKNTQEKK